MNEELKKEIDLFINVIKDSKEYKEYINIVNQMNESECINDLVNKIRELNKQLVKTPSIKLESELKELESELNNIPLYMDYKDKLDELYYILYLVRDKFDLFINEIEN
jgi:cell fate (sporulation/competence/biofilm development) regulator YmcA (YheA/YmcA/DUF963 family)